MRFNPFRRKPDPSTNEALLAAIVALASQGTPQAWRAFYTELLKSSLLIAEDPENSPAPVLLVNKSEEVILPAFTDVARLKRLCPDSPRYNVILARDLCRLALRNEIYIININPEQGPGGILERGELEALANGEIPDVEEVEPPSWDNPKFVPMGSSKLPAQDVLDKITDTASALMKQESH